MIELIKDISMYVYRFVTHRILWLFILTIFLFFMLVMQLFELQIISYDTFLRPPPMTHEATIPTQPLRGTIYDRHGRPLAINHLVFVVKMDPSMQRVITNEALLELAMLFDRHNEMYYDTFPITLDPFEFLPNLSERQLYRWKDDMAIPNPEDATAEESFVWLRDQFNIDPEMSDEDARRILNFRSKLFKERLIFVRDYNPVPVLFAVDVSQETVATIMELNHLFAGVYIDIQTTREYPAGIYMSHIIGYVRPITAEDLEENEHLGYTAHDMFGVQGLERSMEHYLRGTSGQQIIEFNHLGTRIGQPTVIQEALPGDRIFLTIDLTLQQEAYYMLKGYLTQVLINRINLRDARERALTLEEVFISFVGGHNLDVRKVLEVEGGPAMDMQTYILQRFPDAFNPSREDIDHIHSIIIEGIRSRRITPAMMLLTLIGTDQISDPDGMLTQQLSLRPLSAREVLIQKIRDWEITPSQVNHDPSTASMVIVDVPTGAVLAAVSYPSFDNNRLVNNFDAAYFYQAYFVSPYPALPRAFREPRAPGSNFKMITAVAGLEEGVITPTHRITDRVAFTRAGYPPFHCWHRGGHGSICVARAIAGSCNYFFATVSFNLGNSGTGSTVQGIERLNEYMKHFGLHESSGVEILELFDQPLSGYEGYRLASPDFKRFTVLRDNPFAPVRDQQWFDGDTVRTAIGQGLNDYTTAQMARAMNVFANRGVNYPLHMVGLIENSHGQTVRRADPQPVCRGIEFSESTWDVVTEGMRLVTEPGGAGTAVGLFRGQNFPIRIAGKTSTTQQIPTRFNHSAFGAFAPLEDPQISIYVNVPFGATRAYTQISARIARDMIGVALGLELESMPPEPLNTLRP